MMWNWFTKMLGRDEQPKRKKVLVEIPFEQHRFSMDDFSRSRLKFDADDNQPKMASILWIPSKKWTLAISNLDILGL